MVATGEAAGSAGLGQPTQRGRDLLQLVDDGGRTGASLVGLQGAQLNQGAT